MEVNNNPEEFDSIIEEARERYELAKSALSDYRSKALEDTRFYLGDSDNGWQWPQTVTLQRSTLEKRPCLTINITAQHVNQIVNTIKENPPTGRIIPVDDGADVKTAEILEGLIRNIKDVSNADDVHAIALEHAVVGGEGYWRIITEYEADDSFNQVIRIVPIYDPAMVHLDPFYKEIDKSDREWGFVEEDITKEECQRNWPDVDVHSWATDSALGWVKADTVRVADYYCCEYFDDELFQLPDGDTELASRMPQEAVKQARDLAKAGAILSRKVKSKKWKIHKLVGNSEKPVQTTEWVGSIMPIIEIAGKELTVHGEHVKKGIVRDLKDPARMVNYNYSAAIESIALQNKIPYLAAAEAVEGYEQIWDQANIQNRAYLPYNHVDDAGNPIPPPQRQTPAVMPAAQIQLLQISTDQMRAASGQQNANFGMKPEATSGVGIQRLKMQGEVATYHFLDNMNKGLKLEDKILLELITCGQIYDTQRVVQVLGIDGAQSAAKLDPEAQDSYQEMASEIKAIFNPTIGRYRVVIDTGPSFMTKRIEGSTQLGQIAQQNPQMMQVAGDLIVKAMDVPYADKIAERMAKMLPPQLQDKKPGELPPDVQNAIQMAQQHIQQQDQMIQQMQQELQKAKEDEEHKDLELQIKAYQAETDRLAKLGAAMTPDKVIALVQQTVSQALAQPPIYETAQQEAQETFATQQQMQPPPPPQGMGQQPTIG